jgi:hypothetical protein
MYKVTSHNLSPDFSSAKLEFGTTEHGTVNDEQLLEMLTAFQRIRPIENNNAEPKIEIRAPEGRFHVQCSSSKLFLYDEGNLSSGSTEHSPEEILRILSSSQNQQGSTAPEEEITASGTQKLHLSRSISLTMLIVGLALNGYTLYSAFYIDDINVAPPITLITDKKDLQGQIDALSGSFVTGTEIGDRGIVIKADGSLKLLEFANQGALRSESLRTYSIGRRDNKLIIAIKPKGQIEVSNRDTLVLYGDTYRRTN